MYQLLAGDVLDSGVFSSAEENGHHKQEDNDNQQHHRPTTIKGENCN